MSKPFLKIAEIQQPKKDFPTTIEFLKTTINSLEGYALGGVHRWSPQAFTFEFHNDEVSSLLLEKRWENVYALPILKVGVYEEGDTYHINTRYPAYFLETICEEVSGKQYYETEKIFSDFKDKAIRFFDSVSGDIGEITFVHTLDGYDLGEVEMVALKQMEKRRDIYKEAITGNAKEKVKELTQKITSSFDELEGWKIIDVRDYSFATGVENLIFIEFCTPHYAGIAMKMNKKYNLILPCLGSVRSENGYAFINMFLPEFMFRPLFYSVPGEVAEEYADFPVTVTNIIRETCLKKVK
ncbi:hypothetical protein J7M23_03680 [Candidatus Sumerlaeota bacterium]|nr:hypothetical protein [Candidatus Sumerlaeota bacterium]